MEEIQSIPVKSFAAKNCVLALWCTWPKLDEGLEVMKKWGFEYVTGFPWVKTLPKLISLKLDSILGELNKKIHAEVEIGIRRGIGFWTQSASEFILIGKIGTPKRITNRKETPIGLLTGEDRVFFHPIGKHSVKPEAVQDWLERSFNGPYLELFGRRERAGWTVIGDELGYKLTSKGVEPCEKKTSSI